MSPGAPMSQELRGVLLRVSRDWVSMETDTGVFSNPAAGEVADGRRGFAPPMLMYAIERTGEREGDPALVAGAYRAWPNAVDPSRATSFDMLGAADAAADPATPEWLRELLGRYMARYAIPDVGGSCIASPACYNNLKLVDALAVIAMVDAGARSTQPGTRLTDPIGARAAAVRVITERVPAVVDFGLRASIAGRPANGTILSDPPSDPLAYHVLSTFMLAEALRRTNGAGSPPARRVLRAALDALSVTVAADGQADYLGRGQGNVWIPALTVAAMIEGAALTADRDPARASRYVAVARAALNRLVALHETPGRGLRVVPGERSGVAGMDRYVHTVAYNGLALWGLSLAADLADRLPPLSPGALPSAGRLTVLDADASGLAIVGTGRTWLAMRAITTRTVHDLRASFGLLALKIRRGGTWRDLLAPRPKTDATALPDSPGPSLVLDGAPALPWGRNARIKGDTVTVAGNYRAADRTDRRPFRFSVRARGRGAELTTWSLRRGERHRLLIFTRAGTGFIRGRLVTAGDTRFAFSTPIHVRRRHGYHSGPIENLDALVVETKATHDGQLIIRVT